VSPTGRLVLIEYKLWRNPGSRREVVAQLFEYASLMSRLTYSDLEAKLKHTRGLTGENPIFKAAAKPFLSSMKPGLSTRLMSHCAAVTFCSPSPATGFEATCMH
jgi:hypothetical protein